MQSCVVMLWPPALSDLLWNNNVVGCPLNHTLNAMRAHTHSAINIPRAGVVSHVNIIESHCSRTSTLIRAYPLTSHPVSVSMHFAERPCAPHHRVPSHHQWMSVRSIAQHVFACCTVCRTLMPNIDELFRQISAMHFEWLGRKQPHRCVAENLLARCAENHCAKHAANITTVGGCDNTTTKNTHLCYLNRLPNSASFLSGARNGFTRSVYERAFNHINKYGGDREMQIPSKNGIHYRVNQVIPIFFTSCYINYGD